MALDQWNYCWLYVFNLQNIGKLKSRLDRIYIMHNETFLPKFFTMQVYRGIGSSNHFLLFGMHTSNSGWF